MHYIMLTKFLAGELTNVVKCTHLNYQQYQIKNCNKPKSNYFQHHLSGARNECLFSFLPDAVSLSFHTSLTLKSCFLSFLLLLFWILLGR